MPAPLLPVYAATKAAVISLTHSLNAALDADGVRVHALCPGFVDTPMASYRGLAGDEMIQPEDCAEVVRMLLRLSPRARIPQVVIERVGAAGAGLTITAVEQDRRANRPLELADRERARQLRADDALAVDEERERLVRQVPRSAFTQRLKPFAGSLSL